MSFAEFSWTNPTQVITPTHTQVRMMNPVSLWATVAYPITGIVWNGLDPDTDYEFQVRLIRMVDGLVTHQSVSRSLPFTTPAATVPIVDDDGDVTFPDPPGGCSSIAWELQESADGVSWSTIDSGTDTTPPFGIDIDFGDLDPEKLYRVRTNPCGAGWVVSSTFGPACTTAPALADAPFDDADLVAYWPGLCPPDIIVETVSDTTAIHAPSWGSVEMDADGNVVLVSSTEGPVVFNVNTPGLDGLTGDATLAVKVKLHNQPDAPVTLLSAAGLTIQAVAEGSGFKLRASAHEEGAGITTITDNVELGLNAWHDLAVVHDVAAGDLLAYIAGVEAVTALGSVGARHDPGLYVIENAEASRSTNLAVWDRVLAPEELPGFIPLVTVTINQVSGQVDPTYGGTVVFDVVFSEAVTGFATGDVTLTGTAGATTGTVAGSGTTYTVTATGMTTSGTVIATIAAAKCVSVATSQPNEASTSSDNTVTYIKTNDPVGIFGSKLKAWWDGNDPNANGTGVTDDTNITTWKDKSGNARDLPALGASGVNGGHHRTNVLNGKGIMRFDGNDDGYSSSSPFIFDNGTIEIWAVVKSDESGTGAVIAEGHHSNAAMSYALFDLDTPNDYHFGYENSSNVTRFANAQDRSTNDWDLVIATDKGAATGTSVEVVDVDSGTTGSYDRSGGSVSRLGVGVRIRSSNDVFFDGDIADLIVISSAATSGERTALTNYLNLKFGKSWTPN